MIMQLRPAIELDGRFTILPAIVFLIYTTTWVEPYFIFEMENVHFNDACSTHIFALPMVLPGRRRTWHKQKAALVTVRVDARGVT